MQIPHSVQHRPNFHLGRIGGGAGDIITAEQYEDFELSLEYNISPGGNSGIMFHVLENARGAPWSGAEIQVPAFIRQGDKVKIDVESGAYVERVQS